MLKFVSRRKAGLSDSRQSVAQLIHRKCPSSKGNPSSSQSYSKEPIENILFNQLLRPHSVPRRSTYS